MKTEQPPFFPFWAKDWITSEATRLMSLAARGAYADLLAIAWLSSDEPCTLPDDDASLARLLSVPLREWKSVASVVRSQFELTESGRLRNARLWDVYCEVQAKRDKMSRGGRKGAEHRWGGDEHPNGVATGEAIGVAIMPPLAAKAKAKARKKSVTDAPASGPERPSNFDVLPKEFVDAAYARWIEDLGSCSYPHLRKALLPVYQAPNAPHPTATELAEAIGAFLDGRDADGPAWRQKWTVQKFASELPDWVRLGQMQYVDEWGMPTERGKVARLFGDAA